MTKDIEDDVETGQGVIAELKERIAVADRVATSGKAPHVAVHLPFELAERILAVLAERERVIIRRALTYYLDTSEHPWTRYNEHLAEARDFLAALPERETALERLFQRETQRTSELHRMLTEAVAVLDERAMTAEWARLASRTSLKAHAILSAPLPSLDQHLQNTAERETPPEPDASCVRCGTTVASDGDWYRLCGSCRWKE